ncbi:hypothetical protein K505DRAFT_384431 [Melanomma pulvis-pyrius CBS 109.77]|uniref:Uncharacterized protein n=1 Tax=Melanomma pulvis-pyrius CBS 109.77 TaxID=1314802 RepID=A0A6A6XD04_9PLEO|nr:hypothetical protein K505DRAFT_384431 [Melanomma pulvis-pyrius CBS 109.77]
MSTQDNIMDINDPAMTMSTVWIGPNAPTTQTNGLAELPVGEAHRILARKEAAGGLPDGKPKLAGQHPVDKAHDPVTAPKGGTPRSPPQELTHKKLVDAVPSACHGVDDVVWNAHLEMVVAWRGGFTAVDVLGDVAWTVELSRRGGGLLAIRSGVLF